MANRSLHRLDELRVLRGSLDAAMVERRSLGLITPRQIDLTYNFMNGTQLVYGTGSSDIKVYGFLHLKDYMAEDSSHDLKQMDWFVDYLETAALIPGFNVHSLFANGSDAISKYEARNGTTDTIKQDMRLSGVSYDAVLKFLIDGLNLAKELYTEFYRSCRTLFESLNFDDTLTHELDHCATYETPYFRSVQDREPKPTLYDLTITCGELNRRAWSCIGTGKIKAKLDDDLVSEIRSYFLEGDDEVEVKADYACESALEHVADCRSILELIMISLAQQYSFDDVTCNFIFNQLAPIEDRFKSVITGRPDLKVVQAVKKRYNEYMDNFDIQARIIADAIAKAYVEDRTRLNTANYVTNIDSYIAVLNDEFD